MQTLAVLSSPRINVCQLPRNCRLCCTFQFDASSWPREAKSIRLKIAAGSTSQCFCRGIQQTLTGECGEVDQTHISQVKILTGSFVVPRAGGRGYRPSFSEAVKDKADNVKHS